MRLPPLLVHIAIVLASVVAVPAALLAPTPWPLPAMAAILTFNLAAAFMLPRHYHR